MAGLIRPPFVFKALFEYDKLHNNSNIIIMMLGFSTHKSIG